MTKKSTEILDLIKKFDSIKNEVVGYEFKAKITELISHLTYSDTISNESTLSIMLNKYVDEKSMGEMIAIYKEDVFTEDFANDYFAKVQTIMPYYDQKSNVFCKGIMFYKDIDNIEHEKIAVWMNELNLLDLKTHMLIDLGFKECASLKNVISYKKKIESIVTRFELVGENKLNSEIKNKSVESNLGLMTELTKRNTKLEHDIDNSFKKDKLELIKRIKNINDKIIYSEEEDKEEDSYKQYNLPIQSDRMLKKIKANIKFCLENKEKLEKEELLIVKVIKTKRLNETVMSYVNFNNETDVINSKGESPEQLLLKGLNNFNIVLNKCKESINSKQNKKSFGV